MKQNETSQPGGPSRIRTAAPNKRNVIPLVSLIALIQLLLAFQKWRRKHHMNLELIVSEAPPTGQTRGQSVTSAGPDLIEVTTTVIQSLELQARGNAYGMTSKQRELLPSRQ